jgi:TolB-like protein
MDFAPGSTFEGRYQIIEEVGRGRTGCVYKVFDTRSQEVLALKLISPDYVFDEDAEARFRRELGPARRISHKNICRVHHSGRAHGIFYITMEYVPGQNLKNMLRMMKQLNVTTAVNIARQICAGLAHAHDQHIIHHDLKPSNIMIDRNGNARIMDFGLSCFLSGSGFPGPGYAQRSPVYESPEQAVAADVDERSDIYALGAILYEMVTGRVPLETDAQIPNVLQHKADRPISPHRLNRNVPEEFSRIILKCLAKDRSRRFQNAAELLSDLDQLGDAAQALSPLPEGEASRADDESTASIFRLKRWPWAAGLFALAVLGRLAFLGYGKGEIVPVQPVRKMLVVLPFENLGPPEDDYFADGLTEELSTRLSSLKELGVISRHSARLYADTQKTSRQIHEELGVDYILDGTIQRDHANPGKERVKVTVQLIQAEDDVPLWSELDNLVLEDIFEIQSEIAEKVVSKLDLTLLEPERNALMARPTGNIKAYDLFMQGSKLAGEAWNHADVEEYERAIERLEQATVLDPDFTAAYVTLGMTHLWMHTTGIDRTPARLERAWEAIQKGKQADADSPEVMLAEGFYHYRAHQDYEKALVIFERVKRVRPNLPYTYLGYIQRRQGKWDESLRNLERSFSFHPLSADLAYQIAVNYIHLRLYEEAEEWCNRSLSLDKDHYFSYLAKLRIALMGRGSLQEARIIAQNIPDHQYSVYIRFWLSVLEQDYSAALERLDASGYDAFIGQDFYVPKSLLMGMVYHFMEDETRSQVFARDARVTLEASLRENPEDARIRLSLGVALAILGDREGAVREGLAAVKSIPLERDAFMAPRYMAGLAEIYAWVENTEAAVRQLDRLLSIPCGNILSVPWIRIDPTWDSIREHPAFQDMLNRHASDTGGDVR